MKDKKGPANPLVFLAIMIIAFIFIVVLLINLAKADATDTQRPGILDSMIGQKVRDYKYRTKYTVTPSPTGGLVVRDPKNRYPLYKIEDGKIYNYKREPVVTIDPVGE